MNSWRLEYADNLDGRIEEIISYVANTLGDVAGAQKILQNLGDVFDKIAATPYRFRLHPLVELESLGVRVAVVGSYHVLFVIRPDTRVVRVVDILHSRQDAHAALYC